MKKIFAAIFICICFSHNAFSMQYQDTQKKNFAQSIDILKQVNQVKLDENWTLSKIRIRSRGKIGLELPFLSKLELKPFIEYHFVNK